MSAAYSTTSPAYSPASPTYSPASPSYSPASPLYRRRSSSKGKIIIVAVMYCVSVVRSSEPI